MSDDPGIDLLRGKLVRLKAENPEGHSRVICRLVS